MSNSPIEIPDVLVHNEGTLFLFCPSRPEPRLGLMSTSIKRVTGSGLHWLWSTDMLLGLHKA